MVRYFYLDYYLDLWLVLLSRYLTLDSFNLYFGVFMIFVSILLMIRHKIKPFKILTNLNMRVHMLMLKGKHTVIVYHPVCFYNNVIYWAINRTVWHRWRCIDDPLMLIVFRFPPHVAVGTSMMMIFFQV